MPKVVHCKKDNYDVYIGRPSKWGNPFTIGKDGNRLEVIEKYAKWIQTQSQLLISLHELKGKNIGCWCSPQKCHGDILIKLANKENKMPKTLNAKGKPFSWSFSNYKDYNNCPLKYAHNRFYCTTPWKANEANIWGNRVHAAAENFIKGNGKELNRDIEAFKPVETYVTQMYRMGHRPTAELEITLTENFATTSWFADDAWFRIKIDVLILVDKTKAMIYDWKTGKIREDEDQFKLAAAAYSIINPRIEIFDGKFIWTAHKQVTGVRPLTKEDIPGVWAEFLPGVERMSRAWDNDDFPARPSGLCPWCAVDDCHKRRGERRV